MLYQFIVDYCNSHNISIYKFESEAGIGNGLVMKWKNKKANPSMETMEKISKYTGISMLKLFKIYESKNKEGTQC